MELREEICEWARILGQMAYADSMPLCHVLNHIQKGWDQAFLRHKAYLWREYFQEIGVDIKPLELAEVDGYG